MTVVRMSDIDAQMGRVIDPNSVPKHVGGSQGAMEPNFVAQSDQVIREAGAGRYGGQVFDARELERNDHFGSQTVISLNEAPPLEAKHEPPAPSPPVIPVVAPAPVLTMPAPRAGSRSIAQLMASLRRPS